MTSLDNLFQGFTTLKERDKESTTIDTQGPGAQDLGVEKGKIGREHNHCAIQEVLVE